MRNIYEFSYWLREEADEEKVGLRKLIENFQFEIIHEIPLKVKKLAYSINKEKIGKFGTFYFYGEPQKIVEFRNKVKKNNEILRFIILKRNYLKINK